MLGISRKAVAYILEADRDLPEEFQTKFYVRQLTMEDDNEVAAEYSKAYDTQRGFRRGKSNTSPRKLTSADIKSVIARIVKVENFFIPEDAAEVNDIDPYEHFKKKAENGDTNVALDIQYPAGKDDKGQPRTVKCLKVNLIDGDELKYVAVNLSSDARAEIVEASDESNRLFGIEKNG